MKHTSPVTQPATQPVELPDAQSAQVWLDFDGTVSRRDVLDELILRFSRDDSWKLVEERWQTGLIGSRQCLAEEFALLDISEPELDAFLDTVALDPGALGLLALLAEKNVPVVILSDGIDRFIDRILARHGVRAIPVRANALRHHGRRVELVCPNAHHGCEAGAAHCKCASAEALGAPARTAIHIGDGRSDLCPARKAGVVFAKNALASALSREGRPFLPFATLSDVREMLARHWRTGTRGA